MMGVGRIAVSIAALTTGAVSLATVLRVPENYATIQSALDSVGNGDTVLVAAGTYIESLQAPENRWFVLLGADSADSLMPVVDPSDLDSSTHLACLTLPSTCSAVIAHFTFRNGPRMYPRIPPSSVGGIVNNAASLTLQHCIFDSTAGGVYRNSGYGTLSVADCDFVLNQRGCIRVRSPSRTTITHCDFSAYYDRALWLQDSAVIENCVFHDMHNSGEWMWLEGSGIVLRGCTFGPTLSPEENIIWTMSANGWTMEENTFHDIVVRNAVILFGCLPGDTSYVHRNAFNRNRGIQLPGAGGGMLIDGQVSHPPRANVLVSDNVFDSCSAATTYGFGSIGTVHANVKMNGNVFRGPPAARPTLQAYRVIGDTLTLDNVVMHDCSFDQTGWALRSDTVVHAELNWWGDASGPRHSELNPQGQGDSIAGPVDFIPWLHEDPLFAPEPLTPLAASAQLEVFPNPFNSTTTLSFTLPAAGQVELAVYDLLGREVKVLLNETRAVGEYRVDLETGDWPSGIYFARLQTAQNVKVEKLLLLK